MKILTNLIAERLWLLKVKFTKKIIIGIIEDYDYLMHVHAAYLEEVETFNKNNNINKNVNHKNKLFYLISWNDESWFYADLKHLNE